MKVTEEQRRSCWKSLQLRHCQEPAGAASTAAGKDNQKEGETSVSVLKPVSFPPLILLHYRADQPCALNGGDCNHDHDCQVLEELEEGRNRYITGTETIWNFYVCICIKPVFFNFPCKQSLYCLYSCYFVLINLNLKLKIQATKATLLFFLGQGSMVCGTDNCPYTGGRWDAEDDCCERRCTPDHPCREGEGHCDADADCANSGWARCGDNLCLNTQYFPTAEYPNNTAWFGHSSSDNCCYRVCNKNYNRCGNSMSCCYY